MASKTASKKVASKSSRKTASKTTRRSPLEALGYKRHADMVAKMKTVKLDDGARVKVLVKENPKRGKSAKRFAAYLKFPRLTVAKALEHGLTRGDLRYDVAHKFITLN